ncbi:MAG: tripartite tricarboxylate transporter substrate binding protein [Pseudomonadota bacterium]
MKQYRSIVAAMLMLALGSVSGGAIGQQKWPTKPVRMIVPFFTGSASDVLGRILAQRLTEVYGQQIVVDNRPGAGGLIGSELTLNAAPDGYTIAMVGQPHLSNVLIREKKPYDPLKDFTSISLVAYTHNVIVLGKGVNVKNIPELIAMAKASPGKLNYGSAGVGSSSHLAGAKFTSKANIDVVHVPFRQGPDSRSALLAGTIQFYIYPLPAIMNLIKGGQLKALAVGGDKRAEALPDVPTTAEAGFGAYQTESWFGLIAPRAVSRQIITRLNADTVKVLQEDETRKKFSVQGAVPGYGSPEHFAKMQREEYADLSVLIKQIGMKVQ